MADFWDLLREAFPAAAVGLIGRTFSLIEIAEEEIERARRENPGHDRVLWNAFLLLKSGRFGAVGDFLYRHHCREILGRAVRREDARPATKAEVLVALCQVSLEHPWSSTSPAAYLYAMLFAEVFPAKAREIGLDATMHSIRDLEGGAVEVAARELWAGMSRELAVPDRVLPPERDWQSPPPMAPTKQAA